MREKINGTTVVIGSAVVNILLGLMLLIFEQIKPVHLLYVLCAVCVVAGIIFIVKYFVGESYKQLNCYHFSIGALLVVVGMCALVRAQEISIYVVLCLGAILLISSVVKLQNALDLKAMEDKAWGIALAVAAFLMVAAILVLLNPFGAENDISVFTYVMLVVDGVISIAEVVYLSARIKKYWEKEEWVEVMEESASAQDNEIAEVEEKNEETGNIEGE